MEWLNNPDLWIIIGFILGGAGIVWSIISALTKQPPQVTQMGKEFIVIMQDFAEQKAEYLKKQEQKEVSAVNELIKNNEEPITNEVKKRGRPKKINETENYNIGA